MFAAENFGQEVGALDIVVVASAAPGDAGHQFLVVFAAEAQSRDGDSLFLLLRDLLDN